MSQTRAQFYVCTWDENADCDHCAAESFLHCKWDKTVLNGFLASSFPPYLMFILGMVMVGIMTHAWWPLILFVAVLVAFFGFFEIRILCSHCPFYAGDQKSLKCLANNGALKVWKYHPEPMSRFEKTSLLAGFFLIYVLLPVAIQGYGIWYVAANYTQYGLIALLGMIGVTAGGLLLSFVFFALLKIFFCSACINFSCPLNTVPGEMVEAYLEKNPVMRQAWEKAGWKSQAGI
jgi:hypothetical protein